MLGYHCSCCYSNKRHPRLLSVTKTLTAFYLTKKVLVKKDVKCEHAQRDFAISDAATESFRNKTTIFIESFSEYLNQAKTLIHSGIKPNDFIASFWACYSFKAKYVERGMPKVPGWCAISSRFSKYGSVHSLLWLMLPTTYCALEDGSVQNFTQRSQNADHLWEISFFLYLANCKNRNS